MVDAGLEPILVRVVRDGVVESVHRGHVVVAAVDGSVLGWAGDPGHLTYVRSAAKPFQTLASRTVLTDAGIELQAPSLAITSASHYGGDDHQVEAAYVLARAGLKEKALLCPEALPNDLSVLVDQRGRMTRLAHNCSGKHAGFLFATVAAGDDPARYLDPATRLQRLVREVLAAVTGTTPVGPGVDGCGAPAWILPLRGLATAFARLAAGDSGLAPIRDAMRAHPVLVGGNDSHDTSLMRWDPRVVAKRGAEAVLGWGVQVEEFTLGFAVKILDGGARATGPVAAALLERLGVPVPTAVRHVDVLGGGKPCGALEVAPDLAARLLP